MPRIANKFTGPTFQRAGAALVISLKRSSITGEFGVRGARVRTLWV
jgi:hypothetical protein